MQSICVCYLAGNFLTIFPRTSRCQRKGSGHTAGYMASPGSLPDILALPWLAVCRLNMIFVYLFYISKWPNFGGPPLAES